MNNGSLNFSLAAKKSGLKKLVGIPDPYRICEMIAIGEEVDLSTESLVEV